MSTTPRYPEISPLSEKDRSFQILSNASPSIEQLEAFAVVLGVLTTFQPPSGVLPLIEKGMGMVVEVTKGKSNLIFILKIIAE